ncbi:Ras GTPase [Orbilia oligospora]|uniref:Ras GTPase n=1 Tax=Orbilia oligospora TaxID=2813651 RepID=A0A8H2HS87_ORBOL|nr:Ras GTPase [Orbilia oligospora]
MSTVRKLLQEYKLVVLGSSGSGKSLFVDKFIAANPGCECQCDNKRTIDDSFRKQIVTGDEVVLLDILDTTESEYGAFYEAYIRTSEGFVLLYSITSRQSFEALSTFRQDILKIKNEDFVPMIIVGTKRDLESDREVSPQEGRALADSFGCSFFEVAPMGFWGDNEEQKAVFDELVLCIRRISKSEEDVQKRTGGSRSDRRRTHIPSICFFCCIKVWDILRYGPCLDRSKGDR